MDKLLYAKSLVEKGNTVKFAAQEIGFSADVVSVKLRALGVDTSQGKRLSAGHNRLELDVAEIIRRYQGGESVLSIARHLGVNRGVITKRLEENNIAIRNGSEAMFIRMAKMSFEDRRALSANARSAHIQSIINNASHYSRGPGETEIATALREIGLEVVQQAPFNNGCLDILASGVAIEVKFNSSGCYDFSNERVKEVTESGIPLIFIGFNSPDCIAERLQEIVALTEFACRHPAPLSQHWVIRCRRYNRRGSVNVYDTTIERCSNNRD